MPWLERIVADEPTIPLGGWRGPLAAAGLVFIAGGLRFLSAGWLVTSPFLTFFPAVFAAALIGGLWPGMLAVALSTLWAWFFLIPPYESLALNNPSDALALVLFIGISTAFCLTFHVLHIALFRLRDARRRERRFMQMLEQRVTERTAELAQRSEELAAANRMLQTEMAERARAEEAARQSQKLEAVGQLTGGVAHDFNNLLTVIMGNLEVAQGRLRGREPQVERLLATVMQAAERAASLTHRLLAFSRRQTLAPTPVDLNTLVRGMGELIRRTLGEQVDVEMVLDPDLWRTYCDPHQVETSLLNLVVNARDAMPEGGKLTVETGNTYLDEEYARHHAEVTAGPYAMIAVSDTGAGMDGETLQRAFEPFFTTKDIGRGTGLGLSMVFGFVKQSGGHIRIYSEVGQGTSVKLYLPRLMTETEPMPEDAQPAAPPRAASGCTVLVVEDEDGVREFVVRTLRELGYATREAADSAAALAILGESGQTLDLLLTDVGLPGMNGRALADQARTMRQELKVLFMTGYTRNAIVHGGRLDPGVIVLPKPFTAAVLGRRVNDALAARPAAPVATAAEGC